MINMNDNIPGAPNFLWREVFASDTAARMGINNYPPGEVEASVLRNLEYVMESVQLARDFFGMPIRVTSGYRCPTLNSAIGGSATSFHSHGMAVDLQFTGVNPSLYQLFFFLHNVPFTELIAEEIGPASGWIHYAIAPGREQERKTKYKLVGKPVVVASYEEVVAKAFS